MEVTLQSIFKERFEDYARNHNLPLKKIKAAQAIMQCRTPAMGSHWQCCPNGHEAHIQYHSCRHRSCPQCNALPKAEQRGQALHFTLFWWRYNLPMEKVAELNRLCFLSGLYLVSDWMVVILSSNIVAEKKFAY